MKLLLLTTFVATICYVNAGKKQRMMGGMNGGMNGGMMGGGMNGGMMGMNGRMGMNGPNPGMMGGGMNPGMMAGGGFGGQPQFGQFAPGVPGFGAPNMYPAPAINTLPFMGVPQMNPLQQPLMALTGGAVQQQLPFQPDLLKRFRRQIKKQENTLKTTVATQIPAPTETTTAAPCHDDDDDDDHDAHHHEDN